MTTQPRFRLRYRPVRNGVGTMAVEFEAPSAADAIRAVHEAEGWIYVVSLEELPEPRTVEQTRLPLTTSSSARALKV